MRRLLNERDTPRYVIDAPLHMSTLSERAYNVEEISVWNLQRDGSFE